MRFATLFSLVSFFVADISGRTLSTIYKEATVSDGRILGRVLTTFKNTEYYAFQDIPYAKPPVGPLRLTEPVPPERWEGVLNTTKNSKVCHQFKPDKVDERENEDCLVLNVYTPVDPDENDQDLPVLVWIHGGSFLFWSGTRDIFGPDYFIDQNLVVVTVNYRLGPLGFLSTDDGVVPANLGLKDQHLALKWVNKNIGSFGGDPSKVTIAGQSAGAVSVGYQLLSNKSEGLFRSAIMQSGSPLICWSLHKKGIAAARLLASALSGSDSLSSADILKLVKSADIEQLKAATYTTLVATSDTRNCHRFSSLVWTPVLEDDNDENAFVTGLSHEKLQNGDFVRVPVIAGINSEEIILFGMNFDEADLFDHDLKSFINANMNMKDENKAVAAEAIKKLYTNITFDLSPAGFLNAMSDGLFTTPISRHAILQSQYTDVYFYQFSYLGTLGRYVYTNLEGAEGVGHQEELGYMWHNVTNGDLSQYPKEDIVVHDRVVKLWSQFVKTSNPTPQVEENELIWPKVSQGEFSYLDIDSNFTARRNPKKYEDWSRIYQEYADNKLYTY